MATLRRVLTPEQLTKLSESGSAGLGAAGGTAQWAGQAALGNRPWISHRAGDEAQEDPWDEATGETRSLQPLSGDADGGDAGTLTPLPAAALAKAVAAAKAAAKANAPAIATVLILACNRPAYLERTLEAVTRVHAGDPRFPLVISQDGDHEATAEVARAAATRHGLQFMQHEQGPLPRKEKASDNPTYYRIAAHYAWALDRLFDGERAERVIVLEDDMEVSPDFFEYFAAMAAVLDADPTLWCASSWNDNGQRRFVADATALYRSDFFPGLGWMLTARLWEELAPQWPAAFWDDWMRLGAHRAGRQCVRPEVCRTYNFGAKGASKGQFYKQYLQDVRLADDFVPWTQRNLSYLQPAPYDRRFRRAVGSARPAASALDLVREGATAAAARPGGGGDVVVAYASRREFENAAAALGVFREWKDGVPRAAYRGCVTIRMHGGRTRVFIVPSAYLAEARAAVASLPPRKRKNKQKAAGGSKAVQRAAAGAREPLERTGGGE